MPTPHESPSRTDETSLGELLIGVLNFYRRLGRIPLLLALLCTAVAVTWVAYNPVYKLTTILNTPNLTLDQWRQVEPLLTDQALIHEALRESSTDADEVWLAQMERRFSSSNFWNNNLRYKSALNREDIQQTPSADLRNASTLGLELAIVATNESQAKRLEQAMISNIRAAILLSELRSLIWNRQERIIAKRPELQALLFDKQFNAQQNQEKIKNMQRLLERYPELGQLERNSVVSVQDGGGRYLSPLAQIVALESTIAEDAATVNSANHQLQRLRLYEQILVDAPETLLATPSAERLARMLKSRAEQLKAESPALIEEVRQDIQSNVDGLLTRAGMLHLRAQPSMPLKPILSRSPPMIGLLVFALVFVATSALLALYQVIRQLGMPQGCSWNCAQDPLFSALPEKLRKWLLGSAPPSETR